MNVNKNPPGYSEQNQTACQHECGDSYYTNCAYAWAICLFPVGILCCLRMKIFKCQKCGLEIEDENGQNNGLNTNAYKTGFAIGAVSQAIKINSV
jgi:hypothetical protein